MESSLHDSTNLSSQEVWQNTQCPGLTPSAAEINRLKNALHREYAAFCYKQAVPVLWVVFVGGTGTGKSTLFNVLCQKHISETGVERPKTKGPVIYVHKSRSIEADFPFADFEMEYFEDEGGRPLNIFGSPDKLTIVRHNRGELEHCAFVDTPDLDSLELRHRQRAEDFYLLADVNIFVASQEKYADEVPSQFFYRIYKEEKPYFFLLNKADNRLMPQDVIAFFRDQGMEISEEQIYLIPYSSAPAAEHIENNPQYKKFISHFFQLFGADDFLHLRQGIEKTSAANLLTKTDRFLGLMEEETEAAKEWLYRLDLLLDESRRSLLEELESHFTRASREYLQNEVKKIFQKYDLLRKPRNYISRFILSPFRIFGLKIAGSHRHHRKELDDVRQRVDITPVLAAVERFNRLVLEQLSPQENTSPLYSGMRRQDVILTGDEIRTRVMKEQEKLAVWIEDTFKELARGIPRSKEWGIYSTAVLWGILIVSFEIVLGGGITLLEAALDSILAPFVTKGSAELFASREIKQIARDLDQRYRDGLTSVIREQKHRYETCLKSLTTSTESIEMIRTIRDQLEGKQ